MSGIQLLQPGSIKIYNLTAGKALPGWLPDRKRRKLLQRDDDLQRRIELIQDFEFPTAANCVRLSRDGQYIFAAGTYKPSLKCFEVDQLSVKFERHVNCEVVDMQVLSEDYSKVVMLQADRYIELHASYGHHFRTRIPAFGRAIAYNHENCDLYAVGGRPDVYRINLEQGTFLAPMTTDAPSVNTCEINPVYGLVCVGGIDGNVYAFDPRSRERAGVLDVASSLSSNASRELTATSFMADGLSMGVGTASGEVLIFDLRASQPILSKPHNYGLPIRRIVHHAASDVVLSADVKAVRMWQRRTGKVLTAFEPSADINDLALVGDSGLFFIAGEQPKMMSYFVPELGPAPKWCSYLDNVTDELEEDEQPVVYDDYKFVTREELSSLGLTHLIGSKLLRASMHGYFMDIRLYNKAKELLNPFAFEEYQRERIRAKLEEAAESRLALDKYRQKLPKVNRKLAKRLLTHDAKKKQAADPAPPTPEAQAKEATAEPKDPSNLVGDGRFGELFTNPDFEIDFDSHEYKLLHPHEQDKSKKAKHSDLLQERFGAIEDDSSEDELEGRGSDEESDEDDVLGLGLPSMNADDTKAGTDSRKDKQPKTRAKEANQTKSGAVKRKAPKLQDMAPGEEIAPLSKGGAEQSRPIKPKSFGKLVEKHGQSGRAVVRKNTRGGRVATFTATPSEKHAKQQKQHRARHEQEETSTSRERRGIQSLGLPKIQKGTYWRGRKVAD